MYSKSLLLSQYFLKSSANPALDILMNSQCASQLLTGSVYAFSGLCGLVFAAATCSRIGLLWLLWSGTCHLSVCHLARIRVLHGPIHLPLAWLSTFAQHYTVCLHHLTLFCQFMCLAHLVRDFCWSMYCWYDFASLASYQAHSTK